MIPSSKMSGKLFDPDNKLALKRHGYVFSENEDGSSSSEGDCGNFDEFDACLKSLKPPPINIPLEKIIIIAPPKPDKPTRNKKSNSKKSKNVEKINKSNTSSVSLRNYYEVLEESSSDFEEGKNEDSSHSVDDAGSPVRSKTRKKRRSIGVKSDKKGLTDLNSSKSKTIAKKPAKDSVDEQFETNSPYQDFGSAEANEEYSSLCNGKRDSNKIQALRRRIQEIRTIKEMRKRRFGEHKKLPNENEIFENILFSNYTCREFQDDFKIDILVLCISISKLQKCYYLDHNRRSSWDDISKNNVRRSSLLVEQEYENIVDPKEVLIMVNNQSVDESTNSSNDHLWNDWDYRECLYMCVFLVATVYFLSCRFRT